MKKNLYLLALLLSIGSSAIAQVNENANWVFGYNAGMRFLPNPGTPTSISSGLNLLGSNCTVSDENGDLLFCTNGETVYDHNFAVMTNGTNLYGNVNSMIGVIIIPKSLANKTYYIISIDGDPTTHRGLYYSEVDMSNGIGEVIAATKNTVLKDHNGINIDYNYNTRSRKLTSTLHSNGTDYWLVTQIGTSVYSYLVTQYGISSTPSAVTTVPVNTNLNVPNYAGPGHGQIKISPDSQHIGINYFDYAFAGNQQGALLTGTFNNSNGYVTQDPLIITGDHNFLGLEFSPNSQYIYFNTEFHIAYAPVTNTASYTDVPNMPTPNWDYELIFQRAINGRIYMGHARGDLPVSNLLGVINDPDNYSNPDTQMFSVYVSGFPGICLPQLVPIQPDCEQYIVLSNPDGNWSPFTYSYSDYIVDNQNYTVDNGQDITQKAGNFISIEPDTYIMPGSLFLAEIAPCTGTKGDIKGKAARAAADAPGLKISSDLLVYPNPAKGSVNIAVNTGTLSQVIITSLSGQVLYDAATPAAQNNVSVNVSNYAAGIYFVTAKTNGGKQFTQKLVVE